MRQELFYFTTTDLMIRVEIDENENKAKYHTHRITNFTERILVEKYISTKVLKVEDIYKELEVIEIGVDNNLMKEYNEFQAKGSPGTMQPNKNDVSQQINRAVNSKDEEINAAVVSLCESANKEYWFFKLGDVLRDRNENHAKNVFHRLPDLSEAIHEYNKTLEKNEKRINLKDFVKILN